MTVTLHQLLMTLVERGGTELFLVSNSPPQMRIDGLLQPLDMPPLGDADVLQIAASGISEQFAVEIRNTDSLQHIWSVTGLGRFAITSVRDYDGRPIIVVRAFRDEVYGTRELGLRDDVFVDGAGLYLVGGVARSGRSTVAAAVLDKHNRERHESILLVTAEPQPRHQHKMSIVTMLTASDENLALLRSAQIGSLADLIVFDGRYDRPVIDLALTLCDRGMSVLMVSFGRDVISLIRNLVELFPVSEHATVLARIADRLQWALTSTRIVHGTGRGFVSIYELLSGTPEVRQMLSAARYDNVSKILSHDDPYSPHQALVTSARLVVARGRVSKRAAEAATGLQL